MVQQNHRYRESFYVVLRPVARCSANTSTPTELATIGDGADLQRLFERIEQRAIN